MAVRKELGKVVVDSGTMIVADPCDIDRDDEDTPLGEGEWIDALHPWDSVPLDWARVRGGTVFRVAGDGEYPVIGIFDRYNRLVRVEIVVREQTERYAAWLAQGMADSPEMYAYCLVDDLDNIWDVVARAYADQLERDQTDPEIYSAEEISSVRYLVGLLRGEDRGVAKGALWADMSNLRMKLFVFDNIDMRQVVVETD